MCVFSLCDQGPWHGTNSPAGTGLTGSLACMNQCNHMINQHSCKLSIAEAMQRSPPSSLKVITPQLCWPGKSAGSFRAPVHNQFQSIPSRERRLPLWGLQLLPMDWLALLFRLQAAASEATVSGREDSHCESKYHQFVYVSMQLVIGVRQPLNQLHSLHSLSLDRVTPPPRTCLLFGSSLSNAWQLRSVTRAEQALVNDHRMLRFPAP